MISVLLRTSVIAFTGYVIGSSLLEPTEPDSETHIAKPKRFLLIKGKKDTSCNLQDGSKQGFRAAGSPLAYSPAAHPVASPRMIALYPMLKAPMLKACCPTH